MARKKKDCSTTSIKYWVEEMCKWVSFWYICICVGQDRQRRMSNIKIAKGKAKIQSNVKHEGITSKLLFK